MQQGWRQNPHESVTASTRKTDDLGMGLLRAHLAATAIVLTAVAAAGGVFAFARPTYHPDVLPPAPTDLPYTHVAYHAADTQIAFARQGVHLTLRSQDPRVVGMSTDDERIEVAVFGDPAAVKAIGDSFDYVLDANDHWVHYPRSCGTGVRDAAVWRENVRAIVRCGAGDDATLLRRVTRALASLTRT
jgi:hypothetical protein